MNKNDLIRQIQRHLDNPQKSERWAMYRLITPVVDFANSTMGLLAYFEFNQTSEHKTSQSVDIALLDGTEPRVMVEAKRVDKRIAAEQISKYMRPDVRGVVTNGVHWVMCLNGRSKAVSIRSTDDGKAMVQSLNEVVAFIRGEVAARSGWSSDDAYVEPSIKPEKLRKHVKGRRKSNPVEAATDIEALRLAIDKLSTVSKLDAKFLQALLDQLEVQGGLPPHLRGKVRSSRVAFFDSRIPATSKRVARIELGKQQPDVLVLTKLASSPNELSRIASATPHDKGPHMRRFRLSDESQAMKFGTALAKVLGA